MSKIKGPAIFLAQFTRPEPPFDRIETIGRWAAEKGYLGVQIPTWDARVIDLEQAAQSQAYCDDYRAMLAGLGLQPTELAGHLQGQVLAIHPAYEVAFGGFYPSGLDDAGRVEYATAELRKAVQASANMGLSCVPVLSGGLLWHMIYPWPQRPQGLVEEAFGEE